MGSILDRYIFRTLLINYLIALGVMICLYVVLDMFVNMDEFTEQGYPLSVTLQNMFSYYWPNIFLYFGQLSGFITLFACMSALARLRKLNETTAVLASGVSLYRIAAPIIAFGIITAALSIANAELLIPAIAHRLARDHDDASGSEAYEVLFLKDRNGALVSAQQFNPTDHTLHRLLVITRNETGAIVTTLEADRATWDPPTVVRPQGRWKLERGLARTRTERTGAHLGPQSAVEESYPLYYESDLDPNAIQLRQSEGWIRFLSLGQLRDLQAGGLADRAKIVPTRHARICTPIVNMILLLLGLPFFLDRSPGNIMNDSGKCMIVCGLCYVLAFVAQSVRSESESALPAWIPIFVFATIAVVMIDRIRT